MVFISERNACSSYLCDSEKLMSILEALGQSGIVVGS